MAAALTESRSDISDDHAGLYYEGSKDDGPSNTRARPYRGSPDSCEHLLFDVELTFRTAEGGELWERLNSRWSEIVEQSGRDFDEAAAFDELLADVDSLKDFSAGMSLSCAFRGGWSAPQRMAAIRSEAERRSRGRPTRPACFPGAKARGVDCCKLPSSILSVAGLPRQEYPFRCRALATLLP